VTAFIIVGAPRFVVAALTGTVAPLTVMTTIEGLACGVINPILATTIYQTVPGQLRSRVLIATTASALLIAPLGGLAAGFLAGSAGLAAALLGSGGLYLLVMLCPIILPAWKQIDSPRRLHTEADTRRPPDLAARAAITRKPFPWDRAVT